jgi:hypothetical protein
MARLVVAIVDRDVVSPGDLQRGSKRDGEREDRGQCNGA